MASTSPSFSAPRTVTVRVRSLLVLAVVLGVVALVWWAMSWATNLAPLTSGSASWGPQGLGIVPHTNDTADTGPPVYTWRSGGRYFEELWLSNSASVPITITGADSTGPHWVGDFKGPRLFLPTAPSAILTSVRAFHPTAIPAGSTRPVTLVFSANPAACGNNGPGSTTSTDTVTFHFTALGIFHDSQTVPLGTPFFMAAPRASDC